MLEWLFGKKTPPDLPWYSALKAVPSRGVPDALAKREAEECGGPEHQVLQRELLDPPRRPPDNAPLFTELLTDRGAITVPLPEGGKQCLLVFSTPCRAGDYARVQLTMGPRVQYLSSSPLQLAKMLTDLRGAGVESIAVDRCPRCPTFCLIGLEPSVSADTLLKVWAIHKATETLRLRSYLAYALQSARAGKLEEVRDVALEGVGHVALEDPRFHFLLGQAALGLRDRRLLREARQYLAFFQEHEWGERLERAVQSGSPNFTALEWRAL